ncbi:MAG: 4-hydroxy-tetrahydrodipicolinate synthase [Rhodocyclaceae bacterium]|jgi:4-hydroxy-tetrahydrodipicolinate synthase|uniref:4-hydroxy-tetrahydrodipicolinate synthase n=1 Tax=Fluviibacter phosphoraccumulans TaxID=1751046 RepID=A0A679HRK3_9RHOO|nr:4-hydroxy-tetrahydrodipicolinate synthase [Fluviibacter phosphoraccumulans]MBP7991422.1 4-hydroxy-tetrahydrodipicolinate synthase [Rhodocyclaceae bacterium]BBU68930.1 4-hydroxy-tetrahydrodipicolinate synthase [Fluviibacter phosphoraccumulans]BBU71919.1 4-hydroxy-tetrahydrodipicolinate synthase [Fluviibacter phosphoraccumulans]BCA64836.1 4-hydroxy-tetrahydrodipicolinate synthase [Fluviibacter phosphoraccumulans]
MITGSIVAIVTPMHDDGSLDLEAFRNLVDFHIREKTDAIVVVGTTGESPTVDVDEHCQLIEIAVKHSAGRIPIIAGTGANSTKEAIYLTQRAKDAGADAGLSVVPYYNKPSQEGLYQHYRSIAEAVELPLILYNVPGRTVADMSNDTILRLAQVPGIIGVKDATGNIDRAWDLIARAPAGFALYSGDDMTCMATILMGYHGNISVTANVAPRAMHDMCVAAAAGNAAEAVRINRPLIGLHRHLFCEANPIPVKWAVAEMGLMSHGLRLPLTPLAPAFHERVRAAMKQAGL